MARSIFYRCIPFVALLFFAQPNLRAQAPASVVGGTIQMTISNGTSPFASAGAYRFLFAAVGNTFTVVPLSDSVAGGSGAYVYWQSNQDSAALEFNNGVGQPNYHVALSFPGGNSGTYSITNPAFPGGYQSGTFVFYPGRAPATAAATSRSIYLEAILWSDAANTVTYFTTYDGTTNEPLHDVTSGVALVSGELQPIPGQANSYRADFINSNQTLGFGSSYGFMTLSIPSSNDSDTNTIPDIFQIDKAATLDYTGTLRSDFPSISQFTTRGTLIKEAGAQTAIYSMTLSDASGTVVEHATGIHAGIGYFTGGVNYSRGAISNTMDLVLTGSFANDFATETTTFTATTRFTVLSLNQISIPAFTAHSATGVSVQIARFTLTRQGRKYSGTFQISDGRLDTTWPDYKEWRLELLDTNDANGNGIPDLSDGFVGSVQVNLAPVGAVSAGAQWQVDGDTFQDSGAIVPDLLIGAHTITFKPSSGWTAPAPQTITINANQTTIVTATYIGQPGTLQVNLAPAEVIAAGAQWQVDGGALQNNGATVSGLASGTHILVFKPVAGWTTPASQTITINPNQTTIATATYLSQSGSLQVNLSPTGAVTDGAQWRVDGGALQNNGAILSGLAPGAHVVTFKPIAGWTTPAAQIVAIAANQTTVGTATYLAQSGSLQVNVIPSGAVAAGAQWQVDGGPFQNSGATLSDLSTGSHSIAFKAVNGWATPANQTITVTLNQLTTITGIYVAQTGSLRVDLAPPSAIAAGGRWQVDGGPFQNSGTVISGLSVGSHTITFKPVDGWVTPANQTVTIILNQTIAAAAFYAEPPRLTIAQLPNQQIVVRFTTTPGFQYVLQAASTLTPAPQWADFQTIAGTGTSVEITVRAATPQSTRRPSPNRWFRLNIK
jgi:hypothetical protein